MIEVIMSEEKKMWDTEPKSKEELKTMRVVVDGWENFPMMVLTAFKWIVAFLLASIPVWIIIAILVLLFNEVPR